MLLTLLKLSTFLTLIFSFSLGIFTLLRNHKSAVNRLWFLTSLAVAVWSLGYLLTIQTINPDLVRLYLIYVYIGATLVPILFFHFLTKFLFKNKKIFLIIGYFLAAILLYLTIFTDYLIKGVKYLENFGYYEKVNLPIFYLYLAYFLFYTIFSFYLLIKEYRLADGIRKKQLFFLTLAAFIGLGGAITNFIMDLTGIYPIGQFFVFLYPLLITYGIFLPEVKIKI